MANPGAPVKSLDRHRRAGQEGARQAHGRHAAAADAELFRRRAVQVADRRRHHHRHLQGHRPAHQRPGRRPRHAGLQHGAAGDRQHPGRQDQCHRGVRAAAARRAPRRADRGRVGAAGLDAVLYYGLAAPAGTPRPIIERLNKELRAIVTSDEVKKRIDFRRRRPDGQHARGVRRQHRPRGRQVDARWSRSLASSWSRRRPLGNQMELSGLSRARSARL